MPAYNHEPFIAQALDSVLAQKVTFPYEIVVGEDCSTDGTREVAIDYARRYPDRIRLLLHDRNLGIYDNDQSIIRACRGAYIAWLESDDYWTSPDKLQKQVDLLDANPDYSACFHRAGAVGLPPPATWRPGPPRVQPYYTVDDLLSQGHFIPSCTAVFRAELAQIPAEWTRGTPFLETTYSVRFALAGKIGFLDETLAVFRSHRQGIYGQSSAAQNVQSSIAAHRLLGRHLRLEGRASYRSGLARLYRSLGEEYRRSRRPIAAVFAYGQSLWYS